jgi:hypothetical protein
MNLRNRLGAVLGAVTLGLIAILSAAGPASAGVGNPGTSHRGNIGTVGFSYSYATQWLNSGDSWTFGNSRLVMQGDGNLVIYKKGTNTAKWATGTSGSGNWLKFQTDGNLVVYTAGGVAKWASGTNNKCKTGVNASVVLALQDDSNFVVYCKYPPASLQPLFVAKWASNTAGI